MHATTNCSGGPGAVAFTGPQNTVSGPVDRYCSTKVSKTDNSLFNFQTDETDKIQKKINKIQNYDKIQKKINKIYKIMIVGGKYFGSQQKEDTRKCVYT